MQDLETGSFSSLFPEGYSYKVKGTECLNNKIFIDTDVNIAPNGTISTFKSYRGKKLFTTLFTFIYLSAENSSLGETMTVLAKYAVVIKLILVTITGIS